MSISLSQNQSGSASSSSSPRGCSTNPNSNHGFRSFPNQHQQEEQPSLSISGMGSLRIADSDSASSSSYSFSETSSMGPAALDSCGSPEKVNMPVGQNGIKTLAYQSTGQISVDDRGKSPGPGLPATSHNNSGSTRSQGSMPRPSGRRTQMVSGNHLLNFHYDPISRPKSRAPPPRRQPKRKPYNKDLFLQANYKFVVFSSGNYMPESMDPDKMLEWEDIICVKFSTPFPVQCPICLEDPLCPQITSCGHIFCFPCIMQYFSVGEDDFRGECWKKCPLCFMMISSKDLCTIQIENVKQFCVGDDIEFLLLTRQKDSFSLSLKDNDGVGACEEVQNSFSKFTFTSDVDLSVREAMSDLDSWLARADSGLVDDLEKLPYVCAAMEQLKQRKKYWSEHKVSNGNKAHKDSSCDKNSYGSPSAVSNSKMQGKSIPENKLQPTPTADVQSLEDHHGSSPSNDNDMSTQEIAGGFSDTQNRSSYIFYQAVDGQHLIIHPLNMKCLLHYYGSYDRLPSRISGKILQLETVSQSEAIRRRYRYLSHFSLTTLFQLCEIDLLKVLPADALSPFMTEIKNREKQRKQVARMEHQEKMKAETTGFQYAPLSYNLADTSYVDQPAFSNDDFEALGNSAVISSSPPAVAGKLLFSNVARLGFAAGHDSPALKLEDALPKIGASQNTSGETGPKHAGTLSFANVTSRAKTVEDPNVSKASEVGKKGKKPNRVLLSTSSSRRY
nr:RING finger protein 10 isoform X1 [Ipomoea batatas]